MEYQTLGQLSDLLVPGTSLVEKVVRPIRENLAHELITEEELQAAIRRQGVDHVEACSEVILASNGASARGRSARCQIQQVDDVTLIEERSSSLVDDDSLTASSSFVGIHSARWTPDAKVRLADARGEEVRGRPGAARLKNPIAQSTGWSNPIAQSTGWSNPIAQSTADART